MANNTTLRSTVTAAGELRLSLDRLDIPSPADDEVVVRVQAAPINPSDIGLLLAGADLDTLQIHDDAGQRTLVAMIPEGRIRVYAGRLGTPLPVGNEGAGTIVAAGPNHRHLLGRRVALLAGGMFTQYRKVAIQTCVMLPDELSVTDAASLFVNPLTALAMVETLKHEGHQALVHTAAASNLGRMLLRICNADGIEIVNVVRSPAQVQLLRQAGARHVVDSSAASFKEELTDAVAATGATLAFDAIGGGKMANYLLHAMEAAALRKQAVYSQYGTDTPKQVYIYGSLDAGKTELDRGYGFVWSVGAFLLTSFLRRAAPATVQRMRERVLREAKTTFASHYTATIGLEDLIDADTVRAIARRSTGEKYLLDPTRTR